MAEVNFFSRLLGMVGIDTNQEQQNTNNAEPSTPVPAMNTGTTIQDAINFVTELQSYYYNDICKMQTDLLAHPNLPKTEITSFNRKIKQDQTALSQIDEILALMTQTEREYQAVWRKSVYSFYDEIEKDKLSTAYAKLFTIVVRLCAINTKIELDNVIAKRIEGYRQAWNIDASISIPKNNNAILIEWNNGIETYRFGSFFKNIYASDNEYSLSPARLDLIRGLQFEFDPPISTDTVWVYISSVSRVKLNSMRRTCILGNDWEYIQNPNDKIKFDVVNVNELEQYLKGILQILLSRKTFAVISMIVPTRHMLNVLDPTTQDGTKIAITQSLRFILKERSGIYKKYLITARIDRRNIPEKLRFVPFLKFKEEYF